MMPWVYLHALKDYYDIPWYVAKFSSIKATFNLVPSLLVQLRDYESVDVRDKFIETLRQEVSTLDSEQRRYIVDNLFHSHPETMIKPLDRYYRLYLRRQRTESAKEQADCFADEELLDLQILFLLSWCGNYLREHSPVVQRLIQKGSQFRHEEKMELLHELAKFIQGIIPFYRILQEQGKILISTTPFYHPILPLLADMRNGKGANPKTAIPNLTREFHEDARLHVSQAVELYTELFDTRPCCFWPAEGSVSNEALEMIADAGVSFACTDEDVLFKTIGSQDREHVYRRYRLHSYGRSIGLLFRNKSLSDKIGFDYGGGMSADDAVHDFFSHLVNIYEAADGTCVVPVILDGENAWEHYPNNGREFFEKLYTAIEQTDWVETLTVADVFSHGDIEERTLESIKPGSWINGDFGIWLGEPEENEAWELLAATKKVADAAWDELDESTRQKIQKELMIAEGSDWYWWFGYDHYTPIKNEFDYLFRKHLMNVYQLLNREIPKELHQPISRALMSKQHRPISPISPVIDGKLTSYFEWHGCGRIELNQQYSAMNAGAKILEMLCYGEDEKNLYFRIEGRIEPEYFQQHELVVEIMEPKHTTIKFPLGKTMQKKGSECASQKLIEICLEKKHIGWKQGSVEIVFHLYHKDELIERSPGTGAHLLEFNNSYQTDWYV